jgi:hypothetical protein
MAELDKFTYELNSSDLDIANIAKIRLEVGDTDPERGIRPHGDNYTDDEILYAFNEEERIVGRAAAKICEMSAAAWTAVPRTMFGALFDPRSVASNFMKQSVTLRQKYGYSNVQSQTFSVPMKRS